MLGNFGSPLKFRWWNFDLQQHNRTPLFCPFKLPEVDRAQYSPISYLNCTVCMNNIKWTPQSVWTMLQLKLLMTIRPKVNKRFRDNHISSVGCSNLHQSSQTVVYKNLCTVKSLNKPPLKTTSGSFLILFLNTISFCHPMYLPQLPPVWYRTTSPPAPGHTDRGTATTALLNTVTIIPYITIIPCGNSATIL